MQIPINNRDFKGIWIPREIYLDNELGWVEKFFLSEIDSLANNGQCFASNAYFGEFFQLSKDRVSKVISGLVKKGYIEVNLIYKEGSKEIQKRIITTNGYKTKLANELLKSISPPIVENNYTPIVKNNDTPIGESNHTPIGENAEDINTSFINTNIINNIESAEPPMASPPTKKNNKRKVERIAYAHNVFLTKNKYESLCKEFGKEATDKKIAAFSKYQDDPSKKKYSPMYHYRTLKNWLAMDGKPNVQHGKTRSERDKEELERLLKERGA